jgi:hypothetical protein
VYESFRDITFNFGYLSSGQPVFYKSSIQPVEEEEEEEKEEFYLKYYDESLKYGPKTLK